MKTRRTLWLYCILATLGLAGWMIAIVATAGPLRTASEDASDGVKESTSVVEAQRQVVNALEEDQRRRRAELTAEDAIRLSVEVQVEQSKLQALDQDRAAREAEHAAALTNVQNHMKPLIPIIALLILHIVGTMLFWPRPEEKAEN